MMKTKALIQTICKQIGVRQSTVNADKCKIKLLIIKVDSTVFLSFGSDVSYVSLIHQFILTNLNKKCKTYITSKSEIFPRVYYFTGSKP